MEQSKLTARQQQILSLIEAAIRQTGAPPTRAEIAKELGYEGEFIINQNAISKGIQFFPKYLNESLVDYPDGRAEGPFPRRRADT